MDAYTEHMKHQTGRASRFGAFAIGATFIGSVIGAGFASGQEILQFFTAFGPAGLVGLFISLLLFAVGGARILSLGLRLKAQSHRALVHYSIGPVVGKFIDGLLTLFLLGTTAAMASGAGATFFEEYGIAHMIGSSGLIVLTVGTVLIGIRGVVKAVGLVAPFLIVSVFFISIQVISSGGGFTAALAWRGDTQFAAVPFWFIATPLYVAYNLFLTAPVLAPLGAVGKNRQAIFWGGFLGGTALGLCAVAMHLALAGGMPGVAALDIPILQAVKTLPSWLPHVYAILLLAEIYSTAVATLFGFASRIAEQGGGWFYTATIGGGFISLIIGQLQFSTLIGTLYPVIGVVGIIFLVGLFRQK